MEIDVVICKTCSKPKKRIYAGKYRTYDKRYVDENGLLFNGLTCGSCNLIRVRTHMAKIRAERKAAKQNA